jgi:hypothetical protein
MKLVVIRSSQTWTDSTVEQVHMEIPAHVDMKTAEDAWFASGGGSAREFCIFLINLGAKERTDVLVWNIHYQS